MPQIWFKQSSAAFFNSQNVKNKITKYGPFPRISFMQKHCEGNQICFVDAYKNLLENNEI